MSRLLLPLLGAVLLASSASAQTTTFSYSGTGLPYTVQHSTYSDSFSLDATGPVTGLGNAQLRMTGSLVRERGLGCGDQFQTDITFSFGSADSFTLSVSSNVSNFGRSMNGVVTAGTGAYQGRGGSATVVITFPSAGAANLSITGSLNANGPAKPASILPSGIVPLFSSVPIVQSGSWISIYGKNLANSISVWDGRFITDLGGVSVSIGAKPAYIWLVSPNQLNVQVPDIGSIGCVNVIVTTPNGTAQSNIMLAAAQPSFSLLDAKYVAATISTPDGSGAFGSGVNSYDIAGPGNNVFPYKTRPAKAGEIIAMYGVGFGPTAQPAAAGQYAAYPIFTFERPIITIGGQPADWVFSGLVGPGLYQLNVRVPAGLKPGDQPVVATVVTQTTPLLFSSFKSQNCADPDPQGAAPTNCAVYISVQ